jgi:hypothetical protein
VWAIGVASYTEPGETAPSAAAGADGRSSEPGAGARRATLRSDPVLALAVSCAAPLGARLAIAGRAGTGASSGTTIDGTRDVSPTAEPAADAVVDVEGARARPGRSVLGTPLLATLRAGDAARANGSAAAGITGGANDRGDGARTAASAGGVRPGRRAGDALLLLREVSASEEGTRPGARDAAGLGAMDTRQQGGLQRL